MYFEIIPALKTGMFEVIGYGAFSRVLFLVRFIYSFQYVFGQHPVDGCKQPALHIYIHFATAKAFRSCESEYWEKVL